MAVRAPVKPTPAAVTSHGGASNVFGWAAPIYLLLLSGGFAFLRSPLATMRGNELSVDRAAFTVINAITLTGFQQTIATDELRAPGQFAVFALMAGGALLTLIIGGQLVTRIAGLPFSNRLIAITAGCSICVAALFGAAGLGDTVLHGAFQGVSALGNCGLFIGKIPASDDFSTPLILLPLAVAGGLGIVVWLEVFTSFNKRRPISPHSLIALSTYGAAYIIGTCLLMPQLLTDRPIPAMLATCSASAITARSAGFGLVSIGQFTRAGQWILAGLMILGPASGGTGGGIKGTTLVVLHRGLRRSYAGERAGRAVSIAAVWIGAYALLVFVGFLVLTAFAPQIPGDRLLFLAISAASNVGLSHDPVSLVKSALGTLSVMMLLGRMLPMAVLFWMVKAGQDSDVAVG